MFHLLDLIGTFAFAVYGAYLAERKGFDLFGISINAFVSGLGGITIRELLLNHLPIYFSDPLYLSAIILGILTAILTFKNYHRLQNMMLIVDALGLVTFAFIGAKSAAAAGLGLLGILFFSTISAVGGGIIRDLMLGKVPEIFYQDFYATPAIILGIGYYFLGNHAEEAFPAALLLVSVYLIRIIAIHYKLQLWKPNSAQI